MSLSKKITIIAISFSFLATTGISCSASTAAKANVQTAIKILSTKNISLTTSQNTKILLPKTVQATLSNKSTANVQVKWNFDNKILLTPGSYTVLGTVNGYTKKAVLTVIVTKPKDTAKVTTKDQTEKSVTNPEVKASNTPKITYVEDRAQMTEQNSSYTLPQTTYVRIAGGATKDVPVNWESQAANTSATGIYNFQGKIDGWSKPFNLKLYVINKLVEVTSGVTLNEVHTDEIPGYNLDINVSQFPDSIRDKAVYFTSTNMLNIKMDKDTFFSWQTYDEVNNRNYKKRALTEGSPEPSLSTGSYEGNTTIVVCFWDASGNRIGYWWTDHVFIDKRTKQ